MTGANAITVESVSKRFGEVEALSDVSFDVPRGTVLGVLGPNGAGKTTLVRILATLTRPTTGRATVDGFDCITEQDSVRGRISLVSQASAILEPLTGRQKLTLTAKLHHLSRADAKRRVNELLQRFDLVDAADRAIATYSGGMQRRLDLAAGLVAFPSVLFLDEPTTGLDPRSRMDLWDLVREATAGGTTTILTTQYLDEADELADRIAVLGDGGLLALDTPAALKGAIEGGVMRFRTSTAEQAQLAVNRSQSLSGVTATHDDGGTVTALLPNRSAALVGAILRLLDDAHIAAAELVVEGPSLDSVFLSLTESRRHAGERTGVAR